MQVSRESSNAYLGSGTEQIRLQQAVQTRSLTYRQGESAFQFVRIFKVLEVVHELLRSVGSQQGQQMSTSLLCCTYNMEIHRQYIQDRKASNTKGPILQTLAPSNLQHNKGKFTLQQPLLLSPFLVDSTICNGMQDVHEAIQDTVSLLRVPRSCLNICCSSRGAVSGLLHVQEHQNGPWIDCSASGCKFLPGDCNAILNYCFQTTAQYIVVVEKDVSTARTCSS